MKVLPQEIQVWYVLPALRRELAKALIEKGLSQKKVAAALGITEGAISQYLNSKRGVNVQFEKEIISSVKDAAERISGNNSTAMEELIRLSEMQKVKLSVCQLHMEQDPSLPKGCDICFRH